MLPVQLRCDGTRPSQVASREDAEKRNYFTRLLYTRPLKYHGYHILELVEWIGKGKLVTDNEHVLF